MYSSICVRGFRCLEDFCVEGLGRVNLLVGVNNSGKTSILEGVQLLSSPSPSALAALAIRRGESQARTEGGVGPFYAIDMSHLFAGRDLAREVVVTADRSARGSGPGTTTDEVRLRVGDAKSHEAWGHDSQLSVYHDAGLQEDDNELMLRASWTAAPNDFAVPLTADGELLLRSRLLRKARDAHAGSQLIGTNGMTAARAIALLDDIVLTENEEPVTHALRLLEPRVERVASIASERDLSRGGPVGIFVKLRGVHERVPIGSTGDGMWRVLGLALALAKAKGGILLVDEIDTGLHYSVMAQMWRMVCEQAADLSVQVFATTHSRDCYESLAAVVKADVAPAEGVTIQRIEEHRKRAVAISGDAIGIVADRGLEIR